MRLTNFALVTAAVALASSGTASAATDLVGTKLSTMVTAGAARSIEAAHGDKRLLRLRTTDDDYDEDDDNDEDDDDGITDVQDEERAVPQKWTNQFAKWHGRNEKSTDVYQRYALEPIVRRAYSYGKIAELDKNVKYQKWAAYVSWLKKNGYE
ncbi:hypothetical protein PHYBOEH_010151 [Phytophthora boehmeriae]|uniref:RxLR effector protein n=1 Tax=Phytophthora boehmeriae TaxID=109152 RepID=A0A8T1VSL3_9STRA|nr:hypothetical protein PHYBOEH_010151 [Phytophthora boehmeriae]